MRVLVTGASGYVGRAVVHALLAAGHQVRGLARGGSDGAGIEWVPGDIQDRDTVARAADGVDGIVHLAGRNGVRESFTQKWAYFNVNVSGTVHVLSARPLRLGFASTARVYGEPAE